MTVVLIDKTQESELYNTYTDSVSTSLRTVRKCANLRYSLIVKTEYHAKITMTTFAISVQGILIPYLFLIKTTSVIFTLEHLLGRLHKGMDCEQNSGRRLGRMNEPAYSKKKISSSKQC